MFNTLSNNKTNNIVKLLLLTTTLVLNFEVIFSLKLFSLLNVLIILVLIQIIHLFFYFTTIYQFSKYTSVSKFFWIRTFTIFWGLEFYLFIVVMFLFIIAPAELPFFWNPLQFYRAKKTPYISLQNTYTLTLITLFNINVLSYYAVYRNKLLGYLNITIFVIIFLSIILKEFDSYYYYSLMFYYKKHTWAITNKSNTTLIIDATTENTIEQVNQIKQFTTVDLFVKKFQDEVHHYRAKFFILHIMLFIKFLHVYIIAFINFIYIYLFLKNKTKNIEILGVIQQNVIILLIFWALNYVIFFKLFYKYKMYGFYKTISFFDVLTDWSLLYEEFYLI